MELLASSRVGKRMLLGLALGLLAAACSTTHSPYGQLTDLELSYVIPESDQWGGGDPCAEADCGGDVDSSTLRAASWVVVEDIAADESEVGSEATVEISLRVVGPVRGTEQRDELTAAAWGPDVAYALEALAAGHELWAATRCGGLNSNLICHFVAIDDRDRFAGIGYGEARYFTVPMAREAAHRGSLNGRQFLEDRI